MKNARSLGARVVVALGLSGLGCPQLLNDDFKIVKGSDAGEPPIPCAFELCGSACVDLESNPFHCGGCDSAIGTDQICSLGTAVAANTGCGMRTLCSGGCVNTESHPMFCGACDVECKPGARCMMGNCMCGPPASKDCGDSCRQCCDDSDCGVDKVCSAGVCELECGPEEAECGDRCVILATDPKNCGECRRDCGMGGVCVGGVCG